MNIVYMNNNNISKILAKKIYENEIIINNLTKWLYTVYIIILYTL